MPLPICAFTKAHDTLLTPMPQLILKRNLAINCKFRHNATVTRPVTVSETQLVAAGAVEQSPVSPLLLLTRDV